MIELDRAAKKYMEIESFSDYELTQCVAYELAIRNPKSKNQFDDLRSTHNNDAYKSYKHEIKRAGYNIITYVQTFEEKNDIGTRENLHDYLLHEDTNKNMIESKTTIEENFKRPKLQTDHLQSIQAKMTIDLNKPLDELLAYVTHVKKDIDRNKDIVKAPIELFGEALQKADDMSRMCTETKNGKEICFDGRNGITRTQKLADMFFVYDATEQGAKELRIRTAISEYYKTIDKTTDMSDTTFRKYRNIAIDYIENERFRELITGVKS